MVINASVLLLSGLGAGAFVGWGQEIERLSLRTDLSPNLRNGASPNISFGFSFHTRPSMYSGRPIKFCRHIFAIYFRLGSFL